MHMDRYERYWLIAVSATLGVFAAALLAGAVIFGVRAPDFGGFINPSLLNETQFAAPGITDLGNNQYEVNMVARMWSFSPAEIRVPVGAVVTFNVTSADITHGFIIERHNINFEVIPGHIARARITFEEAGTFHYICHEYCGRGHHTMYGAIIVEESVESVRSN
jgi:cytochrome c oxidase subunit II